MSVTVDPPSVRRFVLDGDEAIRKGDLCQARFHYDQALEIDPLSLDAKVGCD